MRLTSFYVSPVCAPTRASLMTGRYNYRTGVVDTYLGRALMHPRRGDPGGDICAAPVIAPAFLGNGIWETIIRMRPIDQGFQEAWVHKGGGIGQPSDPPGGESYFNPILQHNGRSTKTRGYCSDVFTDAAIKFITRNRARPFLLWLAFNAPHTPLQVPTNYQACYESMSLAHRNFRRGHALARQSRSGNITAKVYGMINNIDDNVGPAAREAR